MILLQLCEFVWTYTHSVIVQLNLFNLVGSSDFAFDGEFLLSNNEIRANASYLLQPVGFLRRVENLKLIFDGPPLR